MSDASLAIQFSASESAPDLRVRLEAEPGSGNRPTLDDIDHMLARAMSGMSARTVQIERCKAARFNADGELILTLAVLAWPSRIDLRYTLELPEEAKPGPVTVIREERVYKAWASGGGVVELPWRMESAAPAWAYGCWDAQSLAIPGPALRHDQARILVEGERAADAHGIVAVTGAAIGFRHEFSLVFGKFDDRGHPQSIDIDRIPITARWIGADGEEATAAIDIPVPDCAKALLAECPGGTGVFASRAREARELYEIAYSTCTGQMLGTRRVNAGRGGS